MKKKTQKQFILIDGYTLVIHSIGNHVEFLAHHSRQSCSVYNDSNLIQFLANQTLDNQIYQAFWHSLNQCEPYSAFDTESYYGGHQDLLPIAIADADQYQDWSLWELIDSLMKTNGKSFDEPIWRWVPGSYYPDHYMAHSTVLKIVQVARSQVESQQVPTIAGVEGLSEQQWTARFDPRGNNPPSGNKFSTMRNAETSLLIPPILRDLENAADRYLQLFDDNGRLYTPTQATYLRQELLNKLGQAQLIDREISTEVFEKLAPYPRLYRCVTVLPDQIEIQLLESIANRLPQNPSDLFVDPYNPSYLELLTWASLADSPPPIEGWGMAIDWTGREGELVELGSDPSLPQADRLLGYLACHFANLWCSGNLVAFNVALAALNHPSEKLRELRSRCILLRSGELKFNYADWCRE
jgi:hypothetical protein